MSTNSNIILRRKDDIYQYSYCHWDGYLEHNGNILYKYYDSIEKIEKLLSYGDISYLGSKLNPSYRSKHTMEKPQKDVCLFYHRDRKEPICRMHITMSPPENQEYNYLFDSYVNMWYVNCSETNNVWRPLGTVLKGIGKNGKN